MHRDSRRFSSGTSSMMKKNLKMAIELAGWGKYGLWNKSLSGVNWLGGCGGICGNDVLFRFKLLHYCNRNICVPTHWRGRTIGSPLSCDERSHRYIQNMLFLIRVSHENYFDITYPERPSGDVLQNIFDITVKNCLNKPTPVSHDSIRPVYVYIQEVLNSSLQSDRMEERELLQARLSWYQVRVRIWLNWGFSQSWPYGCTTTPSVFKL